MEAIQKSIEELRPYKNNPRKNDAAVPKVAESIKRFGFKIPILIDADNVIIAGHTRLKAAKSLGYKTVPCVVVTDLTPDQIKALRLADNKVAEFSEWDQIFLDQELEELKNQFNMAAFGFDLQEAADDFELPQEEEEETNAVTLSVVFTNEQKALVDYAMENCGKCTETFGNTNKKGNQIYEVIRQWTELKQLKM